MAKRYYWLKLMDDFFQQSKIRKLRKIAGGDTYTIIYLKMQLLSLKNEGILYFEGTEENFVDEIALIIDEEVENVRFTVMYLLQQGLIDEVSEQEFALIETMKNIGRETDSAERVRRHREKKKMLQSNGNALLCNADVTTCNTEKRREEKKRIDKENNNAQQSRANDIEKEFEDIWKDFPNKKGKSKALGYYKKARENGVSFETIKQGVLNYAKECSIKRTEKKYIKHGSTWFSGKEWESEYDLEELNSENNKRNTTLPKMGQYL